ncbi:MAG: 3-deoxy-7-phosphoheptulonate synthase, partial [Bryobacteraceae bacterium]
MEAWSPKSWQTKPALQQPVYPSEAERDTASAELSRLPPLVTEGEIDALKAQLAEAAAGRRFLLQGGDCAERFDDC